MPKDPKQIAVKLVEIATKRKKIQSVVDKLLTRNTKLMAAGAQLERDLRYISCPKCSNFLCLASQSNAIMCICGHRVSSTPQAAEALKKYGLVIRQSPF